MGGTVFDILGRESMSPNMLGIVKISLWLLVGALGCEGCVVGPPGLEPGTVRL